MSNAHVKYLLIGGGVASSSAAAAIRKQDPQGEIMLVGQEPVRPYDRPPLSKQFLRDRSKRRELFVQPDNWYAEQHIQLRTGVRASHLDTARHIVSLENGDEIAFDKLLIATGMSPAHLNIPGRDLPNLYYLRTLGEADRLHHAIDKALHEGTKHARGRGRAAVIGGGVLGVELAASLTQIGLAVDLICSGPFPWHKFAGEHTAKFLSRFVDSRGITLHTGRQPLRLEGDGRVQRVVLDESTSIGCDFAIASVGAVVNKELLRGTPIVSEKAIRTDEHCRTNIPDIYAAGDCAAVFDPLFNKHRLLDHWDNAKTTGAIAGNHMAGGDAKYDVANYFFSDVFELALSGWGEARQVDRRLIRGSTSTDNADFVEIGIAADGRIAQILAINHANEDDLLKSLVAKRAQVGGREEELKDPAFPLTSL